MGVEAGTSGPQINVARGGTRRAQDSAVKHHRAAFPGRHRMGAVPRNRPQQKGANPSRHVRKNENGKVPQGAGERRRRLCYGDAEAGPRPSLRPAGPGKPTRHDCEIC